MKYIEDTCSVDLSLDELCERVFGSGSFDIGGGFGTEKARLTPDIYAKVRGDAQIRYRAQEKLTNTFVLDGIYYTVSTEADGVIEEGGELIADEIRRVRDFDFSMPPREIFVARMKCCAYFLACREDMVYVRARLTYVHAESGKIRQFKYEYHTEDLRAWYVTLLRRISRAAKFQKERVENILPSAAGVAFPYGELREGQEMMIRECYRAIKRGERLFVEAPTGTGKTISSL